MKEINLLPPDKRFSFKQFILKRVSVLVFVLNIVFLISIFGINLFLNSKLEECLKVRKGYLNEVSSINSSLLAYEKQYRNLIKKLGKLKKEEERLRGLVFVRRSAFASFIVYLNTFSKGVSFDSVNYNNGNFKFTGLVDSLSDFQRFYSGLERNRLVKDLKLYSVKKSGNFYRFEVSYEVSF